MEWMELERNWRGDKERGSLRERKKRMKRMDKFT